MVLATRRTPMRGSKTLRDKNLLCKTLRFSSKTNLLVRLFDNTALSIPISWLLVLGKSFQSRQNPLENQHFSDHSEKETPPTSETIRLSVAMAKARSTTTSSSVSKTQLFTKEVLSNPFGVRHLRWARAWWRWVLLTTSAIRTWKGRSSEFDWEMTRQLFIQPVYY